MKPRSQIEFSIQGTVVLERFEALGKRARDLAPFVTAFAGERKAFEGGCARVEAARTARDAALAVVAQADAVLDPSLDVLADGMVGSGLGKRRNPFAEYGRYSPSKLKILPVALEAKAVVELVAAIRSANPPAAVARLLATSEKNAHAVESALKKVSGPQAAYAKAMADRDALLPGWMRAYERLKKHAAAHWSDDPATYEATFAPPEAVQRPVKKSKPRKKPAKPAPSPA